MVKIQSGFQIQNDPRADYSVPLPTATWFPSLKQAKRAAVLAMVEAQKRSGSVESERDGGPYEDDSRDDSETTFFLNSTWNGVACLMIVASERWIEWMDEWPA